MNTQTPDKISFRDDITKRRKKTDEQINEIDNIINKMKNDIKMKQMKQIKQLSMIISHLK